MCHVGQVTGSTPWKLCRNLRSWRMGSSLSELQDRSVRGSHRWCFPKYPLMLGNQISHSFWHFSCCLPSTSIKSIRCVCLCSMSGNPHKYSIFGHLLVSDGGLWWVIWMMSVMVCVCDDDFFVCVLFFCWLNGIVVCPGWMKKMCVIPATHSFFSFFLLLLFLLFHITLSTFNHMLRSVTCC